MLLREGEKLLFTQVENKKWMDLANTSNTMASTFGIYDLECTGTHWACIGVSDGWGESSSQAFDFDHKKTHKVLYR